MFLLYKKRLKIYIINIIENVMFKISKSFLYILLKIKGLKTTV